MTEWYIIFNGQQVGPLELHQLSGYGLNPQSKVWKPGFPDWVDACTVPELAQYLPKAQEVVHTNNNPVYPAQHTHAHPQGNGNQPNRFQPTPQNYNEPAKSHIVAGVYALTLGTFGAHYFYTGHSGAAILTIVLCLVTCGLWSIVNLVIAIQMLNMTQQEFEHKYLNSTSFMPI